MQDEIKLVRARIEDANLLYKLQIETFMPLYEKYHDDSTSPAKETLESITRKITDPNSEFYIIFVEGEIAGGIRIRHHDGKIVWNNISWISPLFIISDFQNTYIHNVLNVNSVSFYIISLIFIYTTIPISLCQ